MPSLRCFPSNRLLLLAFFLAIFSCQKQKNNPLDQTLNFIIILADDLGYGDLSCYGHPTIKSPNLDQMAEEGIRFTQFYMAASLCTPSRAALLTGKLPIRTGMSGKRGVLFPDSGGGLPDSIASISKVLKNNAYATACIGKWHLGHLAPYLPSRHGFDYYFGIPYSNDMSPEQNNWEYAKAAFPPTPLIEGDSIIEFEPDQSQLTQRYTQKAIQFIEAHKDQAFFLYLAHTFPHVPLYIDSLNEGRSKRGLYGDVVEVLDASVGEILNSLKEFGLAQNTLVIFTSDNGPWAWAGLNGGSAGLLKGKKGSPWEGGYRVPFIAWMPGKIQAGQTNEAIGTAMDLFPTFLSISKIAPPKDLRLDGTDISASLFENQEIQQEVFFFRQDQMVALRRGPWKIFLSDPDPWNDEYTEKDLPLLFNVEEDPSEHFNRAKDFPALVVELSNLFEQHQSQLSPVSSQLDSIHPDYREVYDRFFK